MNSLDFYRGLERRQLNVDGFELSYRKVGRGPAVVFVHGWPLHGATWRHTAQALAERYTCYLPDLPGAGDSPWRPCELFSQGGELIAGMADALDLGEYALVGHDSGGAMARVAAAKHGARVKALVLGNTEVSGHHPGFVLRLQQAARLPGAQALFKQLLGSRSYLRSAQGFGGCFHDLSLLEGDFHAAFIEPLRQDPSGAFGALISANLRTFGEVLERAEPKIRATTHLVWGAEDPFFPPSLLPALQRSIPDVREPVIVQQAKLLVHEEHPELFTGVCREAFDGAFATHASVASA